MLFLATCEWRLHFSYPETSFWWVGGGAQGQHEKKDQRRKRKREKKRDERVAEQSGSGPLFRVLMGPAVSAVPDVPRHAERERRPRKETNPTVPTNSEEAILQVVAKATGLALTSGTPPHPPPLAPTFETFNGTRLNSWHLWDFLPPTPLCKHVHTNTHAHILVAPLHPIHF